MLVLEGYRYLLLRGQNVNYPELTSQSGSSKKIGLAKTSCRLQYWDGVV